MSDPIERLRAANPVPDCPPRPIEELWLRLDADVEPQPQLRGLGSPGRTSIIAWWPGTGGVVVAISATLAVGVALLAVTMLGRSPSSSPPPSNPPATSTTVSRSGTLPLGSEVGAGTGAPNTGPGSPILSTVKLLVQTRDPRGGLLWGLREFQTTGGQTCLQVGRVQNGTIGVIGTDGAWGNDHRFHPISPNASVADYCSETDRDGHAFENVTQASVSASGGGQPAEIQSEGCGIGGPQGNPCRKTDLRVLQYGLLGPDAVGITFISPSGRTVTAPTVGHDGGYLIVGRATQRLCRAMWRGSGCGRQAPGGYAYGPTLSSGLVTTVRYRDGHVCRVPPPPPPGSPAGTPQGDCPVVGYVAPGAAHLTAALLAAPVTARKLPSKLVVDISFTAHVAVTNDNSYYEYTLDPTGTPNCSDQTGDNTAGALIRAGQRVVLQDHIKADCTGVLKGTVAYVPNVGPVGSGYPTPPGGSPIRGVRTIAVGHFSIVIP